MAAARSPSLPNQPQEVAWPRPVLLYAYCGVNPLANTDPTGYFFKKVGEFACFLLESPFIGCACLAISILDALPKILAIKLPPQISLWPNALDCICDLIHVGQQFCGCWTKGSITKGIGSSRFSCHIDFAQMFGLPPGVNPIRIDIWQKMWAEVGQGIMELIATILAESALGRPTIGVGRLQETGEQRCRGVQMRRSQWESAMNNPPVFWENVCLTAIAIVLGSLLLARYAGWIITARLMASVHWPLAFGLLSIYFALRRRLFVGRPECLLAVRVYTICADLAAVSALGFFATSFLL